MSNHGRSESPYSDSKPRQHSLLADVTFASVTDNGAMGKRSSSSHTDPSKSEREKWSARGERIMDRLQTPKRSLSGRKSQETQQSADDASGSVQRRGDRARRSMLEDRSSRSARSEGKRRMEDDSTSPPVTRASRMTSRQVSPSLSRTSGQQASSRASSSQYAEPSSSGLRTQDHRLSKSPSMDPAQLVQMALNLSESRKRHSGNPAGLAVPNAVNSMRPVSAGFVLPKTGNGDDNRREVSGSRASSQQQPTRLEVDAVQDGDPDHYHFSPATLARAEKARKYFELANKHRRLLAQLQPVPHSNGHTRLGGLARAHHHTSHERVQEGREYNPLQALRNRRTREQQKDNLCSVEQFLDLDSVEEWLVKVESAAEHGTEHPAQLPAIRPADEQSSLRAATHKRNRTADTVITKQDNDWYISPAELLADIYWTEQRRNGCLSNGSRKRSISQSDSSKANGYPPGLKAEEVTPERKRHGHRHLIPLSAANRLRQHGFPGLNRSASVSSTSSTESRKRLPNDVNIGPLQRQMDELIRKDAHAEMQSPIDKSPDHWDLAQESRRGDDHSKARRASLRNGHVVTPASKEKEQAGIMKPFVSSPVSSHPASPIPDRLPAVEEHTQTQHNRMDLDRHKSRLPLFRARSKERGGGTKDSQQDEPSIRGNEDVIDPSRLSVEATRPATFHRHKTVDSVSSSIRNLVHTRSKTDGSEVSTKDSNSAVTRFLRGGKLGDMVRSESSKFGNKLRGRDRSGEDVPSDVSAIDSEASDMESAAAELPKGKASIELSDASPRTSLEQARKKSRYQIPHLPSFRSPQVRDAPKLHTIQSNESGDHISRQQAALRKRNRSPRFERLAPPRINLPDSDTDSKHLALPTDKSSALDERRKSYGFLDPASQDRSRSQSKTRPLMHRGSSGGPETSSAKDSRHWSITNQRPPGIFSEKSHDVNSRDVARVRGLLLASGIKAREISRRLEAPSAALPNYLLESARLCEMREDALQKRPRRQEYTYAVELLSAFVDEALGSLGKEIEVFQSEELQALITRQDQLKARVSDDLTEMVHRASDHADAFNIELSTQATLRTKQVDDAVDALLRLRRRQFRLLRLTAFKILEWATLSLLWWVWFVVFCFKTVQRVVVGFFRLLRWLFTF